MRTADFDYALPPDRIAQYPLADRSASRLLALDGRTGRYRDARIRELPKLLQPGDLLVFNDTRVLPARLQGHKASGGAVEILIERVIDEAQAWAQIRASHAPRVDSELPIAPDLVLAVRARQDRFYRLGFPPERTVIDWLERHGHVPLPPYIERADTPADREQYQTVFARHLGSVAAPTAGLHFDVPLLEALDRAGLRRATVTLHVGAGTFQPVRTEDPRDHHLHREWLEVSEATVAALVEARAAGHRIVAVGTTALRSLETAAQASEADGTVLRPFRGETDLFILPGYRFRLVDALITNFHLPQSTLLMLVCALGGYSAVMAAYRHAVASGYRFFSYGDAMLVSASAEARPQPPYRTRGFSDDATGS